jgi:AcrB/AcrD/AcrF family protein/YtkA-like protein
VMLLYLDHAWDKFRAAGRMNSMTDLHGAVVEGAVQRIRPKIMTICAILFGLLPIMWSPTTQSGADVMKRIAAPMIGGVITSGILELLLYPVIYVLWRKRHLGTDLAHPGETMVANSTTAPVELAPLIVSATVKSTPDAPVGSKLPARRPWLVIVVLLFIVAGIGGFFAWQKFGGSSGGGTPFATQKVKDLTINFIHPNGQLQKAMNDIFIEFRDSTSGKLVDVGTVKFDLDMNMPGMVMHSGSTIEPTETPGQYRAKVKPDMGGDWTATLRYDGPHGDGNISFSVNVKQ